MKFRYNDKQLDEIVDPLIEKDFRDLALRAKRQLKEIVKLTGGKRKRVSKNLDELLSLIKGLHLTLEDARDNDFDTDALLKPGKSKVKLTGGGGRPT